ncbi:MAG TPA: CPBP family intramembrane glutamic endopeptidase [Terracidiphilus sp.]|nr:CPBP family intramembrane glutamic endopeptidase [Terracidiphilus sp.]
MSASVSPNRPRALLEFFVAVLYFFFARALAHMGAQGLVTDQWNPLVEQTMLAFLLLVGYAAMGFWFDREAHPVSGQGFPRREGFTREFGTGLAAGWGLALVCVLLMAVGGGIAVAFSGNLRAWGWFVADAAFFAMFTLAEEIAFRGYGFQRFEKAFGPVGASLAFAVYYAFVQRMIWANASRAAVAVSIALALVLSVAYLRTRALWLSWGLNFGWKASRALVFGLAVSGDSTHSPVVQGNPMGPFWLTGGGFGLDGTWFAFFLLLAALPVLFRITRELDFKHNAPVLVPGGIPVDIDAAARAQHEAAMGPAQNAAPALVQIASTTSAPIGTHPQGSPENQS